MPGPTSSKVIEKEASPVIRARAVHVGRWLCAAGAAVGALGLIDAFAGSDVLPSIVRHHPRMTPNGGLGLLLIGVGGLLRGRPDAGPARRGLALLAALGALAIGILTLGEYVSSTELRIDRLIVGGSPQRRPALPTALALSCLAGAVMTFDVRSAARARPPEWLAVAAGLIALTALLGFVFGAELRQGVALSFFGIAPPTAAGLLLVSIGLLLGHPMSGAVEVATSSGPGGEQFRRFLVPVILVPIVLGTAIAYPLRDMGGEALTVALALLAPAMILAGVGVLMSTALSLNRSYKALEASREWTRALVEQAPEGVFVADITGRYTDVNDAGCRMLGFSRDEILAMTVADLLRPEDVERLSRTKSQLLAGGTEKGEWDLRRKDGSYMTAAISAKIFPDGRWQGLVRDMSERKRLEEELRVAESEQKFLAEFGAALASTLDDREAVEITARRIAAELADGCTVETSDENGRLRERVIVHRDPDKAEVCRELERLPLERPSLGSGVRAAKKPLLVHEVTPPYLESLGQNDEQRRLLRALNPTSFMILPLQAHGGVVGSITFFRTTAGHLYTERDLPFAEAVAMRAALAIDKAHLYRTAQDAIRLREDVLSIVAHDLRNPLGTILMQAELLRRRNAVDEASSRKAGEVVGRAATRMNHLIQDLLDVARMEGGRLSIERERVPARDVIADAAQAHAPLASSASLDLRLDTEGELPEIWADRRRILQVFENLVGNAIKFTSPGGLITVGAESSDGQVLFWVADTGAGIPADQVPHVFERLWQGTAAGQQGAGLGLPIVKGIVEAHGGHVWVESKVGEGTTFFFTIPTALRPPVQAESRPA